MKTAGIVTIYDLNNYGNRLQNYAMQKILSDMGFAVKTYTYRQDNGHYGAIILLKYCFHMLTRCRFSGSKQYWQCEIPRRFSFRKFTEKYLPTEMVDDLSTLQSKADVFVLGSDQVWNAAWFDQHPLKKHLFLLDFAEPYQKVCFSPSFGAEKLPEEWMPWFRERLSTFRAISVREDAGAGIIENLVGKKAEVLIDPTMMLDASDWLEIAKKPRKVDTQKPYILTCFLGNRTEVMEQDIRRFKEKRGFTVHHLVDRNETKLYKCGPSEFVYLFSKADLVLTDSFHASVFSILFGKPFLVYDRDEDGVVPMNSRLDTLLSAFGLQRKYKNSGIENDVFEHDYVKTYQILDALRDKAKCYLQKEVLGDELCP